MICMIATISTKCLPKNLKIFPKMGNTTVLFASVAILSPRPLQLADIQSPAARKPAPVFCHMVWVEPGALQPLDVLPVFSVVLRTALACAVEPGALKTLDVLPVFSVVLRTALASSAKY